jgi:UDP-N-acetyl-2-amino-2-deoxyglucuronate dehydrogenase
MADKVKLAFVGCGAISQTHLWAIGQGGADIEITAAVDTSEDRANAMAEATGARAFTSLEDALADGDFDAVDLMLPHHLHERVTLQALEAGKHVLLEKPMAPTVEACERILDAASQTDRVFMVAENAQYWPEVLTTKKLIDEGAIGEITTMRAAIFFPPIKEYYAGDDPWRFDKQATGGGIVIDTGSHWIRPMRMLLGEIDEVVAALDRPVAEMEGESLARAIVRFRSGKLGGFDALINDAPMGLELFFRVHGSRGEITIDAGGQVTLFDEQSRQGRPVGEARGYFDSYPGEFVDFAAAVLEGRPLAAGPEVALGELRTALAMYRSAESGRWEKVW